MDMENGDQVTKRGCLYPQDSRRGGGGLIPLRFPPYLRHLPVVNFNHVFKIDVNINEQYRDILHIIIYYFFLCNIIYYCALLFITRRRTRR